MPNEPHVVVGGGFEASTLDDSASVPPDTAASWATFRFSPGATASVGTVPNTPAEPLLDECHVPNDSAFVGPATTLSPVSVRALHHGRREGLAVHPPGRTLAFRRAPWTH